MTGLIVQHVAIAPDWNFDIVANAGKSGDISTMKIATCFTGGNILAMITKQNHVNVTVTHNPQITKNITRCFANELL